MSAFFKTVTLLGFSKLSFSKSGINMNTFQTFQTLLALCIAGVGHYLMRDKE